jgi:hypothetical protein
MDEGRENEPPTESTESSSFASERASKSNRSEPRELSASPFPHAPAPSRSHRTKSLPPTSTARASGGPYLARERLVRWGVEANERLTGSTALVLLVLLAIEGVTVLRVHSLLTLHVFVGMLLIPPVLVKMSSTTWRFARYYSGSPEYRHKGPPPAALRVIGPFVIVLTVVLFSSGVLLLLGPSAWRDCLLQLHQASFIAWFILMTVHVLAHAGKMVRLSTKDWARRTRGLVAGSRARRLLILGSLLGGFALAFLTVSRVGPWSHGA